MFCEKKSSETAACEYVPAWYINTGDGWECPDGWTQTGINWGNAGQYGLTGREQCARTAECARALLSRRPAPEMVPDVPPAPVGTLATSSLLSDML